MPKKNSLQQWFNSTDFNTVALKPAQLKQCYSKSCFLLKKLNKEQLKPFVEISIQYHCQNKQGNKIRNFDFSRFIFIKYCSNQSKIIHKALANFTVVAICKPEVHIYWQPTTELVS
jgi:hypothetical protein